MSENHNNEENTEIETQKKVLLVTETNTFFSLATVICVCGGIWYASQIKATTTSNLEKITENRSILKAQQETITEKYDEANKAQMQVWKTLTRLETSISQLVEMQKGKQ